MSSNKKYWKSVGELQKDNSSVVEALKHKEFVQEIPVDEFLGDKKTLEAWASRRHSGPLFKSIFIEKKEER